MKRGPHSPKFREVVGNDAVGDKVVLAGGVDVEDRIEAKPGEACDRCNGCIRFHEFFAGAHIGELLPAFFGKEAVMCSGEKRTSILKVNAEHLRGAAHPLAGDGTRHEQSVGVVGENDLSLCQAADLRLAKRRIDQGVGREACFTAVLFWVEPVPKHAVFTVPSVGVVARIRASVRVFSHGFLLYK